MKGLKFLASCAAVGAVSVACAAASFAAEWATYVPATETEPGKATITIPADYVTAVGSGDFTLLILSEDEPNITEQNKGCVVQIQQGKAADIASVTVGDLKPDTYYVRVGGANVSESNPNGFVATTMTVNAAGEVDKVWIGNPDGDEVISLNDAAEICKYMNGKAGSIKSDPTDDATINAVNYAAAAYCDGDDIISLNDAAEICKHMNGKSPVYVDKIVDLGTYDSAE